MPTKASITTRTGKGSPLTTAEMDNNLTNLRDQSIGIADDTSTVVDVESGNTLTIAGSGSVSTAASGQTLTITGTGITASSTDTLTNKTIDANGTGNSISNIEVADFAGSAIINVSETLASNDSDTALVTAGAIIDYVDAQDANIASDTLTFTNKSGNISQWTNDSAYITASSTDTLTNKSGNISQFTNDSGYLTSALADVVDDTTPQLGGDLDVNGQSIVSVSNGNIVLTPNGTGKTKITNINYSEAAPHTVTYAATITPDVANGNIQKVTLTGNVTFSAFSNPVAGQTLTLFVVQDGTGSRTLTSTMLFAGGNKTLSTAASAIDIITVHYDGTNYYANLVTNFS